MRPTVRVTSQGFTHCPACSNFIRVAADVSETSCDFCGAALRVEARRADPTFGSRVKMAGRGALLAGVLMGTSVLGAACGEEEDTEPTADAGVDAEVFNNDNNTQQDYGGGGFNNSNNPEDDAGMDVEEVPDPNNNTNDYGAAPINNGAAPDGE